MTDLEYALRRLWDRVNKNGPNGCWLWTGSVNSNGYGSMSFCGQRMRLVHRILYQRFYGVDLPSTTLCLHRCDNRRCVNPDHIFLGTDGDNHADMRAKGRMAVGEMLRSNKLREAQVREILLLKPPAGRAHWGSGLTAKVAKQYGVRVNAINAIWRGDAWAHIQRAEYVPPL